MKTCLKNIHYTVFMLFVNNIHTYIWNWCTYAFYILMRTTKSTMSQKTKIAKIRKLIFNSFQYIPNFSCKYDHFWNFYTIFIEKHFIHLTKKHYWWGFGPPHPPPGMRSLAPHAFGLGTLVSLVSVWIRLAKISQVFCIHEVTHIKMTICT